MKRQTHELAGEHQIKGLMNVQFAIQGNTIFVLEVNPRASRTVPFVSKATGMSLARLAALVMVGKSWDDLRGPGGRPLEEVVPRHFSVKESVFRSNKSPAVDIILR